MAFCSKAPRFLWGESGLSCTSASSTRHLAQGFSIPQRWQRVFRWVPPTQWSPRCGNSKHISELQHFQSVSFEAVVTD